MTPCGPCGGGSGRQDAKDEVPNSCGCWSFLTSIGRLVTHRPALPTLPRILPALPASLKPGRLHIFSSRHRASTSSDRGANNGINGGGGGSPTRGEKGSPRARGGRRRPYATAAGGAGDDDDDENNNNDDPPHSPELCESPEDDFEPTIHQGGSTDQLTMATYESMGPTWRERTSPRRYTM